jgi:hypothetical protein
MAFEKRLVPFGGPICVVFFELQTGIYKREDWPSSFYHFRLRNSHSATHQYTSDWLDDNIAKATVGATGLVYSDEFLRELHQAEMKADKDFSEYPDLEVPKKINDKVEICVIRNARKYHFTGIDYEDAKEKAKNQFPHELLNIKIYRQLVNGVWV